MCLLPCGRFIKHLVNIENAQPQMESHQYRSFPSGAMMCTAWPGVCSIQLQCVSDSLAQLSRSGRGDESGNAARRRGMSRPERGAVAAGAGLPATGLRRETAYLPQELGLPLLQHPYLPQQLVRLHRRSILSASFLGGRVMGEVLGSMAEANNGFAHA